MTKDRFLIGMVGILLMMISAFIPGFAIAGEGQAPVAEQQQTTESVKTTATLKDIAKLYKQLPESHPTSSNDKIEVLEFFWYGCPHCYHFEPALEKWQESKSEYIEFIRVPGVLGKDWLAHARAFYTAQKLGVLEDIHSPLFNAIHKEKRKIYDEQALRKFFIEQGVQGPDFDQVYKSKEVETSLREAYLKGRDYQLAGVPLVIINGTYITDKSAAGSFEKVTEVIDILAEHEYRKLQK